MIVGFINLTNHTYAKLFSDIPTISIQKSTRPGHSTFRCPLEQQNQEKKISDEKKTRIGQTATTTTMTTINK